MTHADRLLAFIYQHFDATGYAPDFEEMAAGIDMQVGAVSTVLRKLHRQDRLTADRHGVIALPGRIVRTVEIDRKPTKGKRYLPGGWVHGNNLRYMPDGFDQAPYIASVMRLAG